MPSHTGGHGQERLETPCAAGGSEFRGENFAVKEGVEIFPLANCWLNNTFTTPAGIVFPEKGQLSLSMYMLIYQIQPLV